MFNQLYDAKMLEEEDMQKHQKSTYQVSKSSNDDVTMAKTSNAKVRNDVNALWFFGHRYIYRVFSLRGMNPP